ncbi:hypothetical protein [Sulfurimonas sp.]
MKNSPNKTTNTSKIAKKLNSRRKEDNFADEIFTEGIKNLFVLKPIKGGSYESYCGK